MRVALFTETFLPKVDGIVTVTCLLLDHLAQLSGVSARAEDVGKVNSRKRACLGNSSLACQVPCPTGGSSSRPRENDMASLFQISGRSISHRLGQLTATNVAMIATAAVVIETTR